MGTVGDIGPQPLHQLFRRAGVRGALVITGLDRANRDGQLVPGLRSANDDGTGDRIAEGDGLFIAAVAWATISSTASFAWAAGPSS